MKTYKEQYDKIVEAYFRDEIKPYEPKFCFCGNLCDNTDRWFNYFSPSKHNPSHGYGGVQLFKMEAALLDTIKNELSLDEFNEWSDEFDSCKEPEKHPQYETALFNGMTAALEVLRQIHAERGDVTAIEIPLVKRELQTI